MKNAVGKTVNAQNAPVEELVRGVLKFVRWVPLQEKMW